MWTTRVSNPVCSPHFRASASVKAQLAAFATGVPPNIYAFHRYTRNSANLYFTQDLQFQAPLPVEPIYFTPDLPARLRSLYTQYFRTTLATYVLPPLLARS